MENRYLPPARQKPLRRGEGPILHENISLSVLRVSNESLSSWGEWVVGRAMRGMLVEKTHSIPS
jgi:hypothetical protein